MLIRAHFDGERIVPDEPVNLPVNVPLSVSISVTNEAAHDAVEDEKASPEVIAARLAAFKAFCGSVRVGTITGTLSRSDNSFDERE